jgi:hypothetical protein
LPEEGDVTDTEHGSMGQLSDTSLPRKVEVILESDKQNNLNNQFIRRPKCSQI